MTSIPVERLRTTLLGEKRIKHNLSLKTDDVMEWCRSAVSKADEKSIIAKGKNLYVYGKGYVLTINARSKTIITANKR